MNEYEQTKYLDLAVECGILLSRFKAESSRVEDLMIRILHKGGYEQVNVLAEASSIIVTCGHPDITRMVRVFPEQDNMCMIDGVNQISRDLCSGKITVGQARQKISQLMNEPHQNALWLRCLGVLLIPPTFAFIFGGSWREALGALPDGLAYCLIYVLVRNKTPNKVIFSFVVTMLLSLVCYAGWIASGRGFDYDLALTSGLMNVVPGVTITKSFYEVMNQDYVSGLGKLFEALIIALAIAAGLALSLGLRTLL